ncbi:uncharacterized protein LOC119298503 [Triticum dicoccoides]|uniref:uncharacterized protein LOC119298503 n=1 Tax=Triticum dicoccoides TaxID=85692 RepID=UPI00188ED4D9|nr:uncharacterized protein LOC119298503 [Triticum dicoccoides]
MEDVARRHVPAGGGADLISALPEDLLLQVLVRLRCARAAARTGLLSRRWRGLWTRLPDLVFRDLALGPLLPALASLQLQAAMERLCMIHYRFFLQGSTSYPDAEFSLEQEIETHLVTDFSVLELHFTTMELDHRVRSVRHVFGAFACIYLGCIRFVLLHESLRSSYRDQSSKKNAR